MLWMLNILQLFSLRREADHSERENAFLQYKNCTRLLDGIEKELGYLRLRLSTTNEVDHSMREDNCREFSFNMSFGL